MSDLPQWYQELQWKCLSAADANVNRRELYPTPGVYAFTDKRRSLLGGPVLYVGMTRQKRGLRGRLSSYLKNYKNGSARGHKGAQFIWGERDRLGDNNVIVHIAPFGGNRVETLLLEANLINLLQPWFNTRDEEIYHPMLDNDDMFFEPDLFDAPDSG
jgi:excinuclease UvrABC nuclease subunit